VKGWQPAFLFIFATVYFGRTANAWAYCRTTTCDREQAPPDCVSSRINGCSTQGVPIAWPSTCVSASVSAYGSDNGRGTTITADTMRSLVHNAFQKWTTVACQQGGSPNFVVDMFPDVACTDSSGEASYKVSGPNFNLWIFRDHDWPHDNVGENAIALTSTLFDSNTGEIYDSDVDLNSLDNDFAVGDDPEKMDLQSVIQHESGHFLGLAHSALSDATMWPEISIGQTSLRILSQDDRDAICAAYPPGHLDPSCDPEPRHGFSTQCDFQRSGCAVAPGRFARGVTLWQGLGLALFGLIASGRRLRRNDR